MSYETVIADFVVSTPAERDARLEAALSVATAKASLDRKSGVLVTRVDFCRFSVSVTSKVPFGYIQELDKAHKFRFEKNRTSMNRADHYTGRSYGDDSDPK